MTIDPEYIKMLNEWRPWIRSAIFSELFVDDIIQDCLVKLWKNYNKLEGRHNREASSYIKCIVRSTTFDHLRKIKAKPAHVSFDYVNEDFIDDNDYDDRIEDIERVLKFLPADQILILSKRNDEMPFKEIAAELGLSINTVIGKHRYARINIMKMLEDPSYRPCRTDYRKGSLSKYHI